MVPMPVLKSMQAWKPIITVWNDRCSGDSLWIPERTNNWPFFISESKWGIFISCSMDTAYKITSNQTEKT